MGYSGFDRRVVWRGIDVADTAQQQPPVVTYLGIIDGREGIVGGVDEVGLFPSCSNLVSTGKCAGSNFSTLVTFRNILLSSSSNAKYERLGSQRHCAT